MGRMSKQLSPVARDLVVNFVISGPWYPRLLRASLLRATGQKVARNALLAPRTFYGAWRNLTIGSKSFVNYECFFELSAPVTIGKNVAIGFRTNFITSSHQFGPGMKRAGAVTNAPITVGDGCWIGANVTILPGVTIAHGAVIAAGSVVTKDIATPDLYAGIPAKLLRRLASAEE